MQHLVVAIRPDADDSIAPVSTSVLHRFEIQPHVPAVLEIWRTQPSNELMGSCFVAIEADTAIATSHTIVVGADLAACLHLATDDEIIAKPCHHVRSADLVFVVPTTTDDYEIIESNQALVERVVLRQLRVVYSGMQCCIHLTPTLKVHLTVEGVGVPARERVCFEIAEGTELAIKTKRRPKGGPSRDPRPAMLANLSLVPAPSAAEITRRCASTARAPHLTGIPSHPTAARAHRRVGSTVPHRERRRRAGAGKAPHAESKRAHCVAPGRGARCALAEPASRTYAQQCTRAREHGAGRAAPSERHRSISAILVQFLYLIGMRSLIFYAPRGSAAGAAEEDTTPGALEQSLTSILLRLAGPHSTDRAGDVVLSR